MKMSIIEWTMARNLLAQNSKTNIAPLGMLCFGAGAQPVCRDEGAASPTHRVEPMKIKCLSCLGIMVS